MPSRWVSPTAGTRTALANLEPMLRIESLLATLESHEPDEQVECYHQSAAKSRHGMTMNEAIIAVLSAAAGFVVKAAWESYVDRKRQIELTTWKIHVAELEKRLSEFYWPIYLRLQRDNVIWQRILDRTNQDDDDRRRLAFQIEKNVLLPNHARIVEIIESKMHLAGADAAFEQKLLAYVRHADVYMAIRAAGIDDKDPIAFDEPWPRGFFESVRDRLESYQDEYDSAVRERVTV